MIETLFGVTLYFGYLRFIRRNESKVDKILREFDIFEKVLGKWGYTATNKDNKINMIKGKIY